LLNFGCRKLIGAAQREEVDEGSLSYWPKDDVPGLQVAMICYDRMQVDNALCDLTHPGKFEWPFNGGFVIAVRDSQLSAYFDKDIIEIRPTVHIRHKEPTNRVVFVDYDGFEVGDVR